MSSSQSAAGARPIRWVVLLPALVLAAASCPARGQEPTWGRLKRGYDLFVREWKPDDPRCHGGDGLGPVYNATSCVACHGQGTTGGAGAASTNVDLVTLGTFKDLSVPEMPHPLGRDQVIARIQPGFRESASLVLHHSSTDPRYPNWRADMRGVNHPPSEGKATSLPADSSPAEWAAFPDPRVVAQLHAGRRLTITRRNPTPLFGVGLIDAIPDSAIIAAAREQRHGAFKSSGRVHRLKNGRVGKFGWKAQVGSLEDFVLTACANELGLEAPGHHQPASPFAPDVRAKALDLTATECEALTAYVASLDAPILANPEFDDAEWRSAGRQLFESIGCASCHRPKLGDVDGIYSDLLLHDMGSKLSDLGQYYGTVDPGSSDSPAGTEWRTPPLWGYRDSGPYLHDGRAQTLRETVALHGGEARISALKFTALSIVDRSHVEFFLRSLAAPLGPEESKRRQVVARQEWESGLDAENTLVSEAEWREVRRKAQARVKAEENQVNAMATRVASKFRIAREFERTGKPKGALDSYREIVRDSPSSDAGRDAAARIEQLGKVAAPGG